MISQKSQLETKINGKDHIYQCDPASSLVEVNQALDTFRSYIYGRIKEAEEQKSNVQQPKEEQKPE